jgi:protein-disulfide isomerase
MNEIKNNKTIIPLAIVVSGILIAGAILYSPGNKQIDKGNSPNSVKDNFAAQIGNHIAQDDKTAIEINPITNKDHIRGNPNAPVKIVEFSDTECPFCKRFHQTMKQVLDEYGKNGQVAWVYRHFPLDTIHPKSPKEAQATECASELGGNDKFWAYLDRLFEVTPSNNGLDLKELPKIAAYVGLEKERFIECLNSGKYSQHVSSDASDAINSGGQGTPWSIVIAPNGKKFPLSGAQPYSAVKQLIETALQEK